MLTDAQPTTITQEQDNSLVRLWNQRIHEALYNWKEDFSLMKRNMDFVAGYQYPGQTNRRDERYKVNIIQNQLNQKVSTLYAKNPTIAVTRRKRLDFRLWDGSLKSLQEALSTAAQYSMAGVPFPPELAAFLADVQAGRMKQKMVSRVAQTLEYLLQYFIDEAKPDFKVQLKQAVRRACICGVAYVKVLLVTSGESKVFSNNVGSDYMALLGRVRVLVDEIKEEGYDTTSPKFSNLRSLIASLGAIQTFDGQSLAVPERIEFDFPPATSIIIDPRCTSIKNFISASWVAQRYVLPVCEVNAIFGTDVEAGTGEGYAREVGQESIESFNKPGTYEKDNHVTH